MSKIRLHGSSSGYTEIAPVAASGNNTITLPNDGTSISKDSAGAIGITSVRSTNAHFSGTTRVTTGITTTSQVTGNLSFNSGYGSAALAFGVRAWADIYWNSGTPTARDSGNVNSISDDGTGDMTISFSNAMPDTNYSCLVSGDDYGNSDYPGFNIGSLSRGKTTGGVSLVANQKSGAARDINALNFAVIR